MRKFWGIIALIAFTITIKAQSATSNVAWSCSYHPEDSLNDFIDYTASDINGNVYIAGHQDGVNTYPFLSKVNKTGTLEWLQFIQFSGVIRGLLVNSNNSISVFGSTSSFDELRYDTLGRFRSQRSLGNFTYPNISEVKPYADSSFALCGTSQNNLFVATATWNRTITGASAERILTDSLGNIYVAGVKNSKLFMVKYNSLGDTIHTYTWNSSVTGLINWELNYPDIYILTSNFLISDQTIVKFDAVSCLPVSSTPVANAGWIRFFKQHNNHFIFSGAKNTNNGNSIFLNYADSTGHLIWSDTVDTTPYIGYLQKFWLDSSGIYMAGTQNDTTLPNFIILKYNYAGVRQWIKRLDYNDGTTIEGLSQANGQLTIALEGEDGLHKKNLCFIGINMADSSENYRLSYDVHIKGHVYSTGVVTDKAGNIYSTGKIVAEDRPGVMLFQKLDAAGNIVFFLRDTGEGQSIAIDTFSNEIIITGNNGLDYSLKIWRYDLNGNLIWKRVFTSSAYKMETKVDYNGDFYVGGVTGFPGGNYFNFGLIKFNAAGDRLWNFYQGSVDLSLNTYTLQCPIYIDSNNNIGVSYYKWRYFSPSGVSLGYTQANPFELNIPAEDGIHRYSCGGNGNELVLCYQQKTGNGIPDWCKPIADITYTTFHNVKNIIEDKRGNLYVVSGKRNLFLTKATVTGDSIWTKQIVNEYGSVSIYNDMFDEETRMWLNTYVDTMGHLIMVTNLSKGKFDSLYNNQLNLYGDIIVYVFDGNGNILCTEVLDNIFYDEDIFKNSTFNPATNQLIIAGATYSKHGRLASLVAKVDISISAPNAISTLPEDKAELRFYPNPCSDILKVDLNGRLADYVTIYDMQGQQIKRSKLSAANEVIITDLAKGLYIAEIKLGTLLLRGRWVKM